MGNLAAALSAQANTTKGPRCTVGLLLITLDDIDAKALRNAMESHMAGQDISMALLQEGHRLAGHTIQRHRRGLCSCTEADR